MIPDKTDGHLYPGSDLFIGQMAASRIEGHQQQNPVPFYLTDIQPGHGNVFPPPHTSSVHGAHFSALSDRRLLTVIQGTHGY